MGIHTSGISIPLSLLMLLGWSLMWIASLTLYFPHLWKPLRSKPTPVWVPKTAYGVSFVQRLQSKFYVSYILQSFADFAVWFITCQTNQPTNEYYSGISQEIFFTLIYISKLTLLTCSLLTTEKWLKFYWGLPRYIGVTSFRGLPLEFVIWWCVR